MEVTRKSLRKRRWKYGLFSGHCLRILEFLIGKNFDDRITSTDISDELKISRSRASDAAESLRRAHFVKFRLIKGKGRRGYNRIFELTLNGLVYIFAERPANWERIGEVVEKQPELFRPIFKNWPVFKNYKIEETIIWALRKTFESTLGLTEVYWWLPPRDKKFIRNPAWTEIDERWIRIFAPNYIKKSTRFFRLSKREEEELKNLIIKDELELKRLLVPEFMRMMLLNAMYDPSEVKNLVGAFCSHEELREFFVNVVRSFKFYYSINSTFFNILREASKDPSILEERLPKIFEIRTKHYDALTKVWEMILGS